MRQRRRGAILPLFAVLIVPLLLLVGLVVDMSITASARAQLSLLTQQAAIGALGQYLAFLDNFTPRASCHGCPLINGTCVSDLCRKCFAACAADEAVSRANALGATTITIAEKFRESGTVDRISDFGRRSGTNLNPGREGKLEIGIYHWRDCDPSENSCRKPCGPGGSLLEAPCFESREMNSLGNNAIRLTTWVQNENNPLRHLFAHIAGHRTSELQVQAIATVLPRNDFFLVDLSPSVTADTHRSLGVPVSPRPAICIDDPWWFVNPECIRDNSASSFTFELHPDYAPSLDCTKTHWSPAWDEVCPNTGGCMFLPDSPGGRSVYSLVWNTNDEYGPWGPIGTDSGMCETRDVSSCSSLPNALDPFYRMYSFKDELVCREIDFYPTWAGDDPPRRFLFDYQTTNVGGPIFRPGGQIGGPQPLLDILRAVNSGMQLIEDRGNAADQFGLLGFDNTLPPMPFAPLNIRELPLGSIGESRFQTFKTATDVSEILFSASEDFMSRGLFPVPGTLTDILGAVRRAMYHITNPDLLFGNGVSNTQLTFRVARNSIFIFTDGFANCRYDTTGPVESWNPVACENTAQGIVAALADLTSPTFVDQLRRSRISVSVAMIGQPSGGHYIVRRSRESDGCMDQVEAQTASDPYIDTSFAVKEGGSRVDFPYTGFETEANELFQRASRDPENYRFHAPNRLYEGLVKPTNGLWIPILPQATFASGDARFYEELNSRCTQNGVAPGAIPPITPGPEGHGIYIRGRRVADERGRILYDPFGRTVAKQLEDAVALSLQSPYVLVEPLSQP